MIGSRKWLREAERTWRSVNGDSPFDPVKAFRHDCLYEARSRKPYGWWGGEPWRLADYDEPAVLHRKFVRYLDRNTNIKDWRLLYRELQHHDLQWWADRLRDVEAMQG